MPNRERKPTIRHKELPLEQKIQAYWKMSSCWNDRPGAPNLNVQQVIDLSNDMLEVTNPYSRISRHIRILLHDVINKPIRSPRRTTKDKN